MTGLSEAPRSARLRGAQIAVLEDDVFLGAYLSATLARYGALVRIVRGTVDEVTARLRELTPAPVAAAVDSALARDSALGMTLEQLQMPFLLVARGDPTCGGPPSPAPLWRWPFAAYQIADALAELIEKRERKQTSRTIFR